MEPLKRKTSWWKWLIMLAISFVLLYFAFKGVKWSDFLDGIKNANYFWICVAMITGIISFVIRGFRWRLLMLPLNHKITKREAYDGICIAYLTNFALPRAGEFARCGVISATGKASFESVFGTVVLERSFDLICYAIILVTVIFGMWTKFGSFITDQILAPITGGMKISLIYLLSALLLLGMLVIILLYVYRDKLKKYKFFNKLYRLVEGLIEGLVAGFKMKKIWTFIIYTIIIWTCYWFMSLATIYAIPEAAGLDGMDALFLMLVGGLGWIVPVQGGIGAFHFILSLALASIYGIPQTEGVIFATISHESQSFTMLLCGFISLISISLRKKKFNNAEA